MRKAHPDRNFGSRAATRQNSIPSTVVSACPPTPASSRACGRRGAVRPTAQKTQRQECGFWSELTRRGGGDHEQRQKRVLGAKH